MIFAILIFFAGLLSAQAGDAWEVLRNLELEAAPHNYYGRATKDRFARVQAEVEAGRLTLDRAGEKQFLANLLKALEIPESSQMLVFSTTSLQLSLISPSNPRALYFNEDTYLGFVPGGRVEIISIDPELGGIFYILDIPKNDRPLAVERSRRCMNCHSGSESGYVPGLVIKSVVPGRRGGSLDAFRVDRTGHGISLEERFGGWYLTGKHGLTNHWANAIGRPGPGEIMEKDLIAPGDRFSFSKYLVGKSDILPQLVHEHQAGFVNRVLQAGYAARALLHNNGGKLTGEMQETLKPHVREIVRYLLLADEARLPAGGIDGDSAFIEDFRKNRRSDHNGASLKDFDLRTRIFRHRCSYMIYSSMLDALPAAVKDSVFSTVIEALQGGADGAHLPEAEKTVIRSVLRTTHREFARLAN
jgi:hypothetical protein